MDGDRPKKPANENCYKLSRVSWALLKLLVKYVMFWGFFSFKCFSWSYARTIWLRYGCPLHASSGCQHDMLSATAPPRQIFPIRPIHIHFLFVLFLFSCNDYIAVFHRLYCVFFCTTKKTKLGPTIPADDHASAVAMATASSHRWRRRSTSRLICGSLQVTEPRGEVVKSQSNSLPCIRRQPPGAVERTTSGLVRHEIWQEAARLTQLNGSRTSTQRLVSVGDCTVLPTHGCYIRSHLRSSSGDKAAENDRIN